MDFKDCLNKNYPKRPDPLSWARIILRKIIESDERGQGVGFSEAMNEAKIFLMCRFDEDNKIIKQEPMSDLPTIIRNNLQDLFAQIEQEVRSAYYKGRASKVSEIQ